MPSVPPDDQRQVPHGSASGDDTETLLLDLRPGKTALPDKQFFKIGEAADIVGVKTHVLRYWESEFPSLRPMKTRGAHRMYRRADVELACLIRRLLHQEGYTIPGAKKRVRELVAMRAQGGVPSDGEANRATGPKAKTSVDPQAARELGLRAELIHVRNELSALLSSLDRQVAAKDAAAGEEPARATVTAVVAKTALITQRTR
ncbi:MAG: MerR family transcriptional regulator [Myxococcales bacterium]